ncbi:FimV/HubP family polar landmark protein [Shewanella gaetbuli]|uniref:Uncharacterized protein n=1 Tax=Shewanella gaetbuli TaxID=220752 RepID=A0A9X2CKX4_9GAMM|nr:FimV/HubP family polar landmark protein [Shewanella gaetbuli]MCL1142084.1 hypothetical protein [Shewanella gaetbuli]
MKAVQICVALAGLVVGIVSQQAVANVSHIGIEAMGFEAGELPKLNVNVVSDHNDLSLLTFYIRQKYKNTIVLEKLIVENHKQNTFILRGEERIMDPNSALIVSEYRDGKWQQYSPVRLFNRSAQFKSETADNYYTDGSQPVAIKTLKSSDEYKQRYQATATINHTHCRINKTTQDTLWKVAADNATQWGTNVFGAMIAIYETNPQAFMGNNIQKLRADSPLDCPSGETLAQYQNLNEDKQTFDRLVAGKVQNVSTDETSQSSEFGSGISSDISTEISSKAELPLTGDAIDEPILIEDMTKEQQADALPPSISPTSTVNETESIAEAGYAELTQPVEEQQAEATVEESVLLANNDCTIDKQSDDSLWRVAMGKYKQWQVNVFGAMLAIYEANPKAFAERKIHQLKADAKLECPSAELLSQYSDLQTDKQKFDALVAEHQAN